MRVSRPRPCPSTFTFRFSTCLFCTPKSIVGNLLDNFCFKFFLVLGFFLLFFCCCCFCFIYFFILNSLSVHLISKSGPALAAQSDPGELLGSERTISQGFSSASCSEWSRWHSLRRAAPSPPGQQEGKGPLQGTVARWWLLKSQISRLQGGENNIRDDAPVLQSWNLRSFYGKAHTSYLESKGSAKVKKATVTTFFLHGFTWGGRQGTDVFTLRDIWGQLPCFLSDLPSCG